eukprot:m.176761 g.176761  ORF g.176761 m.176761 type:complete len:559 (-) comp17952_c3_seq2:882-2558(-)
MVNVRVSFDYAAEKDDELTVKEGDIIENVNQQDGGWWEGDFNGKRGWFPDNFVEVMEEAALPTKAAVAPPPAAAAPTPTPAPAPAASEPAGKKAKVTFDYTAANEDELTLAVGQIVTVLAQEEEGWWDGELDGKRGVFPSNFVELVEGDEPKPAETKAAEPEKEKKEENLVTAKKVQGIGLGNIFAGGAPSLKKTSGPRASVKKAPSTLPAPKLKPTGGAPTGAAVKPPPAKAVVPAAKKEAPKPKCKAMFEYTAEHDDELSLKVGDVIVIIQKKEGEGWWEGDLNGKTGWFPDNFVEELPLEEPAPPTKVAVQPPSKPAPVKEAAPEPKKEEPKKEEPKKPAPTAAPADEKKPVARKPPPPAGHSRPKPQAKPKPAEGAKGGPPTFSRTASGKQGPPTIARSGSTSKPIPRTSSTSRPAPADSSSTTPPWKKELAAKKSEEGAVKPAKTAAPAPAAAAKTPAPSASTSAGSGADSAAVAEATKAAQAAEKRAETAEKTASEARAAATAAQEALKAMQLDMEKMKKQIKVLMSDVDEEKTARLKMQVEVDRVKKLAEL